MWLFLWTNEPSKIFVGDTPISKVFLWDTQVRPTGRLPAEYQEVEYIQSSWYSDASAPRVWQYIDTWYSWTTNNGEVKLKYMPLRFGNFFYWDRVWWAYRNSNRAFGLYTCYSTPRIWLWWNDIQLTWTTLSLNTIYELDVLANNWNATITFNWTSTSHTYTWNVGNGYWYTIFGSHEDNGQINYRCAIRLYYFQMYEWWVLVRDYVPCYRKADSVIWMYDLVDGIFYTNDWTWTFTAWPDVS